MKLEFSRQIFEKYSNIKFHEHLSFSSQVAPCGRTDGRTGRNDEANSCFSQFCRHHYKFFVPFSQQQLTDCCLIRETIVLRSVYITVLRSVYITVLRSVYITVLRSVYVTVLHSY
jgi:hypothetical protein